MLKLSANTFAKWFFNGSYYCVKVDSYYLQFESNKEKKTVPFTQWDGKFYIKRGLCWGRLLIDIRTDKDEKKQLSAEGFSWIELVIFAEKLTKVYTAWSESQSERALQIQPRLDAFKAEIETTDGYMRIDDLEAWQQKVVHLLGENDFSSSSLNCIDSHEYDLLSSWLNKGAEQRDIRNEKWKRDELEKWSAWFDKVESIPMNQAQREAVILADNHHLILAGAGSGKTSLLIARIRYLIDSKQCAPSDILLIVFDEASKKEMSERLQALELFDVSVSTFYQMAKKIIEDINGEIIYLSLFAINEKNKKAWMALFLSTYFSIELNKKRWEKHITNWKLNGISKDLPFIEQINNEALQNWLWRLIELLNQQKRSYPELKSQVRGDPQAESELNLIWPIFSQYKLTLKKQNVYDLEGLIRKATQLLQDKKNKLSFSFSHFLLDEYQDISPSRLAFLQAFCNTPLQKKASLFAVGDDWQAIYPSAGSDVRLSADFLSRFSDGIIGHLDTSYRFNSNIGEVANRFIQVNPKQLTKSLHSYHQTDKKSVYLIESSEIEENLNRLALQANLSNCISVIFIGREHKNKPAEFEAWVEQYPKLSLSFLTVHACKGREADYVFIVDVVEGQFPANERKQGLEYVLLMKDEMDYAEERRLFYVALTRARHACWICTKVKALSPFVHELYENDYPVFCTIPESAFDH